MSTKCDWTYLGIGLAGCFAQAPNAWAKFSSASVSIPDRRLERYFWRLVEGAPVLDKRPAFEKDESAAIRGVVSGPMLEMTMPDDPSLPSGPFDKIGFRAYADYWRKLGARIGFRRGDTIQWEDGEVSPIEVFPE